MNETDHPRDEEIAAFIDNRLPASDRARVALHLSACDDCRSIVAGPSVPKTVVAPERRRRWIAATAAAAAVFLVSVSIRSRESGTEVDRIRGSVAPAAESPLLGIREPRSGADVAVDTLVLRWASAGTGATYSVNVVDDSGVVVWDTRVDSTEVAPPRDIVARLRAGSTYYWRVDALLPDLRTASTGPHGFVPR